MKILGWSLGLLVGGVAFVALVREPLDAGERSPRWSPTPVATSLAEARLPFPFRLVFPHLANGPQGDLSIRSRILLINRSGYTASGRLSFRRSDGQPWTVESKLGTGSEFEFNLEPDAVLRFDFDRGGEPTRGWAEVRSDRQLAGTGIFRVEDRSGVVLSETGIGDSAPAENQLVFFEAEDGVDTGLALCNPSDETSAEIHLRLTSLDGSPLAEAERTLPPLGQTALFVAELFPAGSLEESRGVLSIEGSQEVAALTLRTRGANFTTLPAVPVSSPTVSAASELVFPRVGEGLFGGFSFQTSLLLINPSPSPVEAEMEFFAVDGGQLELTFDGRRDHRLVATIPAQGAGVWNGEVSDREGVVGWARVRATGVLGGSAAFAIREATTGRFLSEVGVPDSPLSPRPEISVEESAASSTGLALTNPYEEDLTVRLRLRPAGSQSLVTTRIFPLPARSHLGGFVPELFSGVVPAGGDFQGSVEIEAFVEKYGEDVPAEVSALTLLSRETGLTSLPASLPPSQPLPLSIWDEQVAALLSTMTLDEKIGQMTLPDKSYLLAEADIGAYFLGGVLSGGNSDPSGGNSRTAWTDQYNRYQLRALGTRLQIPLLYGVDAVHGHNNVRGAVIFPHNIGLGATRNPRLVERIARVTAAEVRATGINWTYSPCVAVPRDERWGRTYEGYGEDPELVRGLARAAVRGYQGWSLNDPLSVVACAKHFVADGGTLWGTGKPIDQGDARISEEELRRIHLPGYLGALQAGVASVMASFSSWNGVKLSGSHYLLNDVLKEELGFEGFLLSDWGAIDQLPGDYRSDVRTAVNSGLDMIMVPERYREFFQTLKSLAQSGEVPMSRIDDAVRRILRVKFAAGLFEGSVFADPGLSERFGSQPHRELAREAVRESMVLLQNRGGLLPLSKSSGKILMTGRNADNLGNQCGGWTIDWQGRGGRVTTGTTIVQAVRATVSPQTEVVYSANGSGAAGSDAAIVVVGETPYAESVGDSGDLGLSAGDLAVLETVRQSGAPIVLVVVSGRPMILGPVADYVDAVVAAWLPGSEGQGVADVLFGDYSPTGKLPCSWPRNGAQIPINIGDPSYDPLFPYGFGLTY